MTVQDTLVIEMDTGLHTPATGVKGVVRIHLDHASRHELSVVHVELLAVVTGYVILDTVYYIIWSQYFW